MENNQLNRYTAHIEGSFVIFIIGMRVNKVWAVHQWWPVFRAMPQMVKELSAQPNSGFLHAENYLYWRGAALIQYWRSFEHLEQFAHNPAQSHWSAWQNFNQQLATTASVGIWHETYQVEAGHFENFYANMPKKGLAVIGHSCAAVGSHATARNRLSANHSLKS